MDLNLLKIYQWLHEHLSQRNKQYIVYTLMVDADYPVYLQHLQKDLPFLPEKRESNEENKLVWTFYNKKNMMDVKLDYCNML